MSYPQPLKIGPLEIDDMKFYILRGINGCITYSYYEITEHSSAIVKQAAEYFNINMHKIDTHGNNKCEWNGGECSYCDGRSLPFKARTDQEIWTILSNEYKVRIA